MINLTSTYTTGNGGSKYALQKLAQSFDKASKNVDKSVKNKIFGVGSQASTGISGTPMSGSERKFILSLLKPGKDAFDAIEQALIQEMLFFHSNALAGEVLTRPRYALDTGRLLRSFIPLNAGIAGFKREIRFGSSPIRGQKMSSSVQKVWDSKWKGPKTVKTERTTNASFFYQSGVSNTLVGNRSHKDYYARSSKGGFSLRSKVLDLYIARNSANSTGSGVLEAHSKNLRDTWDRLLTSAGFWSKAHNYSFLTGKFVPIISKAARLVLKEITRLS